MYKSISVPNDYKSIMDKVYFERIRVIDNIAFLLDSHIKDINADFLNSDAFNKYVEKAERIELEGSFYEVNVIESLLKLHNLSLEDISDIYKFSDDNHELTIRFRGKNV